MSIITLLNTLENEVDALGLIACTTSIITENCQNILYANTIGDYGTGTTVLQYKYLPNKLISAMRASVHAIRSCNLQPKISAFVTPGRPWFSMHLTREWYTLVQLLTQCSS